MGGLTSIDANNFGHIVKKCLGLPKTVRKCDISLYILLSLSDSLISVFSLSHIFKIEDKPLQVQYLINSQYVSLFFIMLCIEFHRAMSKFKGYLRKLIIPAKEGFHGGSSAHTCCRDTRPSRTLQDAESRWRSPCRPPPRRCVTASPSSTSTPPVMAPSYRCERTGWFAAGALNPNHSRPNTSLVKDLQTGSQSGRVILL